MQFAYYEKRNYLNDEKNISAFQQEEKEQARFP